MGFLQQVAACQSLELQTLLLDADLHAQCIYWGASISCLEDDVTICGLTQGGVGRYTTASHASARSLERLMRLVPLYQHLLMPVTNLLLQLSRMMKISVPTWTGQAERQPVPSDQGGMITGFRRRSQTLTVNTCSAICAHITGSCTSQLARLFLSRPSKATSKWLM